MREEDRHMKKSRYSPEQVAFGLHHSRKQCQQGSSASDNYRTLGSTPRELCA